MAPTATVSVAVAVSVVELQITKYNWMFEEFSHKVTDEAVDDATMSDKEAGIEASAISLLTRAVEMDTQRQFTQALVCYQEGIQLLMDVLKAATQAIGERGDMIGSCVHVTLPWPVPSPDGKRGGLGVGLAPPPRKKKIATETPTKDTETTVLEGEGSSFRRLMTPCGESRESSEASVEHPSFVHEHHDWIVEREDLIPDREDSTGGSGNEKLQPCFAWSQRNKMDTDRTEKAA
ncbi:hypothetical protein LSAT2_031378 [Lamellibrachia satsuma]|nr:hypothetical protein LSAT2_031378 [Lamellibrachia satsuma]